ncbi:tRNA (guanosine(46)-N7)-methyltransferase TrmB, partial [Clostridioides difficile]|nr:tRNA (guanosine(46)-N7)-methyltransferase TrmB [Clostridioides difficile]
WSKRRLTHSGFLEMYNRVLEDDGEIHFKTDNEKLFEFSLNEIAANNWLLKNISLDLGNSEYENNVTTEYEDKFMSQGMRIFRCEAKKRN